MIRTEQSIRVVQFVYLAWVSHIWIPWNGFSRNSTGLDGFIAQLRTVTSTSVAKFRLIHVQSQIASVNQSE